MECQHGTEDSEWFCAAEALINCIFSIKANFSHDFAFNFLSNISGTKGGQKFINQTEIQYAQLFFVVGQIAIKMLIFVEKVENSLKMAVTDSIKHNEQGQSGESKEADLGQITGGIGTEIDDVIDGKPLYQ